MRSALSQANAAARWRLALRAFPMDWCGALAADLYAVGASHHQQHDRWAYAASHPGRAALILPALSCAIIDAEPE